MKTAIRRQTAVWTCKDGRKVRVCDMDDKHLLNTIAMLERCYSRNCERLAMSAWAYAYSADTPDGASMCAEGEGDAAMDAAESLEPELIASEYPIYAALIEDKERRGL